MTVPDIAPANQIIATMATKVAGKVHANEAAEQIAMRVKNPTALRGALVGKLQGQRDFAAIFQSLFPWGVNVDYRGDDTSGVSSVDWCKSYGFALRTVQRWYELLEPAKYDAKEKAIVKRCWELAELWQAANYSSESNEWYTPGKYIAAVREALGDIDLDPASSAQANATVRAKEMFTQEDDGLARDWFGRVFVNPPYGRTSEHRSLAAAFCNKAVGEYDNGNVEACIILVNSLHSQTWQAPLYEHTICFVDHRIHFVSADGEENENPTFQNIFIYLGRDVAKFAAAFSGIGYVMRKV